jgi:hypothetical protein
VSLADIEVVLLHISDMLFPCLGLDYLYLKGEVVLHDYKFESLKNHVKLKILLGLTQILV